MQAVTCAIDKHIATVTLTRAQARNTFTAEVMETLRDTARDLARNTEVRAVVLCAEGVFSAGVDLGEAAAGQGESSLLQRRESLKLGPDLCRAWEELEVFTIAAIEGYCVGGAAALVAALDYRICAESTFFRLPEVALGINMSWGSIPRLVAQLGPARAKQYVILCRRVAAQQALEWGLCEQLVADGETLAAALALAEEVASLPPLAVRMSKQAINVTANALAPATCFMDRDQFMLAAESADSAEAIAAFLGKRQPHFKGD